LTLNICEMAADSHSYYGRRIVNRTDAFKRYHFQ